MKVFVAERIADKQKVFGDEQRLHDPEQGASFADKAHIIRSGQDDAAAMVKRPMQLQEPGAVLLYAAVR